MAPRVNWNGHRALDSMHTIGIEGFVPRYKIDEVDLDNSHSMAPEDNVADEPSFVVAKKAD